MAADVTRRSLFRGQLLAQPIAAIGNDCLATSGVVCRSCGDACPEQAIRFVPRIGSPALPDVLASRCNACGACLQACPTSSISIVAERAKA